MKHSSKVFFALIIMFAIGCSSENLEDIHPELFVPSNEPCDTASMTYDNNIKALFTSSCGTGDNNCHKTPNTQDVNLDNYSDARDLGVNGDLMPSILHLPGEIPMPPVGSPQLTNCNIQQIQAWVNNGCPE